MKEIMNAEYYREVEELMRKIGAPGSSQLEALEGLHRVGVWSRGSILPRGTIEKAAVNRLPHPEQVLGLHDCLHGSIEVRGKAAHALGQWGGEESVDALEKLLSEDSDSETRLYALAGLRTIGGPKAGSSIIRALEIQDPEIQDSAISAIMDLATGGSPSAIDSMATIQPLQISVGPYSQLTRSLKKLRDQESAKLSLRYRAGEAWEHLRKILIPTLAPPTAKWAERPKVWQKAAGEPKENSGVGGHAIPADLVGTDGRTLLVEILTTDDPAHLTQIADTSFYLNVNGRLVVTLRMGDEVFPPGVNSFWVLLTRSKGDANPIPPHSPKTLTPGQVRVLEFAVPPQDLDAWCNNPRFLLKPADEAET